MWTAIKEINLNNLIGFIKSNPTVKICIKLDILDNRNNTYAFVLIDVDLEQAIYNSLEYLYRC